MDKKFIITTSIETKEKLLNLGFDLIMESGNSYTFLNNHKFTFSTKNNDNVVYTNKLAF